MDNSEESKGSQEGWLFVKDEAKSPKFDFVKQRVLLFKIIRSLKRFLKRKVVMLFSLPILFLLLIGAIGYVVFDGSPGLVFSEAWSGLQKNSGKIYDKFFSTKHAANKPSKLLVNAKPWADVYLNGSFKGKTPFPFVNLAEGVYVLELKNSDFADSLRKELTWKVNGRDTTISYAFQVRKACSLLVSAETGTEVYIGQQAYGSTNSQSKLVLQNLAPGKYKVKFVKPDICGVGTKDIELKVGEQARISYRWSTGSLTVNATPWGIVYIDEKRVDETPLTKDIALGKHRLKVVREGLPDFVRDIIIDKDEPTEISVE